MSNILEIKDLSTCIGEKQILKNFSLNIPRGEVHALMGINGTGKSTLSKVIAGSQDYQITSGSVNFEGVNILGKTPEEISKLGLFLAFQYPFEIQGVSIANFIRACLAARLPEGEKINAPAYYKSLYEKMDILKIDRSFTSRSVNVGFSGGEKKRCDILQMLMLNPSFAVMDETDSGLDIDALKIVAQGVNLMRSKEKSFLIITHYQRLLNYIKPDVVHVMIDGKIVKSGPYQLALELEEKGYEHILD